jgi:hypothetical protein
MLLGVPIKLRRLPTAERAKPGTERFAVRGAIVAA